MTRKITALEPQKRSKDRVNVFLDGEFAFGLAASIAVNLQVGDCLSGEEIAALKIRESTEKARNKALDYLSYRPRSEAELRSYLAEKEFTDSTIDDVIDRLRRVNLVDDGAFASYWVENRAQFRPRGKRALTQELRQKGISSNLIDQALEDYDEATAALHVAESQARRLKHLPPEKFTRRLQQRMARRGFSYDLIRDTLAELALPSPHHQEREED